MEMAKNSMQLKGFSVIELMIVLAVAAVLLATAVPAFNETIQNNRLATQVNELHAGLSVARSEAVKRNASVKFCLVDTSNECTESSNQWIVFLDDDGDDIVDTNEALRVSDPIPGGINVTFSDDMVVYASSGLATNGVNEVFTLCDLRGATDARGLVIGPSGRPRLALDSDEDGTLEDQDDHGLTCSS